MLQAREPNKELFFYFQNYINLNQIKILIKKVIYC